MTFVFWQNVISIHQSAFIKALSKRHKVVLVVERELGKDRAKQGWNIPSMGDAIVYVAPNGNKMDELLVIDNCQHIFSGIDGFPMVFTAFKEAVAKGLQVSVFAEPYDWRGIKGFLRQVKYWWLFKRYGRYIRFLFTTGRMGQECYEKCGFPTAKIRQWGYFTEQNEVNSIDGQHIKPNIIFIGMLDERKNILALIDAVKHCDGLYNKFYIIGGGPLEKEVKTAIQGCKTIEAVGSVPNEDIKFYLSISDLLVLPSLFDGWGAVINEALSAGTRVLCSEYCGASTLLDGKERGGIFKFDKQDNLEIKLAYWLQKGCLTVDQRNEIRLWAKKNISGDIVSQYFEDCIQNKNVMNAPWITPPSPV